MIIHHLLLLFLCVIGVFGGGDCPVPEDRQLAWYSGAPCQSTKVSCCFTELINNVSLSCCYAYGTDGPIKCCGRDDTSIIVLASIFSVFGVLGISVLCLCFWLCGPSQRRRHPSVTTDASISTIVATSIDTDVALDPL